MSRRHRADKREINPDPKFGDLVVSKFMNNLMYDGKKSIAESIVYGALETVEAKSKGEPKPIIEARPLFDAAGSEPIAYASITLAGKYLFDALRIPVNPSGWAARGFALGTASHGIGAARALQVNADAGAYAGLALGLQVVLASLLIPLAFRWF